MTEMFLLRLLKAHRFEICKHTTVRETQSRESRTNDEACSTLSANMSGNAVLQTLTPTKRKFKSYRLYSPQQKAKMAHSYRENGQVKAAPHFLHSSVAE